MKDGKLMDDILGAKFGTKNRSQLITRTTRLQQAVKDILWMARRYADGRRTYAPSMFNDAYDILREELGDEIDSQHATDQTGTEFYDITIEHSKDHPYALHGNENSQMNQDISNKRYHGKPICHTEK